MVESGDKVREDFFSEAQEIIEGLSRNLLILDDLHHKQRSTAQDQDEVVDVDLVKKEAVMIVVKKLVGTL